LKPHFWRWSLIIIVTSWSVPKGASAEVIDTLDTGVTNTTQTEALEHHLSYPANFLQKNSLRVPLSWRPPVSPKDKHADAQDITFQSTVGQFNTNFATELQHSQVDQLSQMNRVEESPTTTLTNAPIFTSVAEVPSLANVSGVSLETPIIGITPDVIPPLKTPPNVPNHQDSVTSPLSDDNLGSTNPILADRNEASEPNQWTSARPDGHAPIGVMGDHTHGAGEFMVAYRYMFMNMEGNRDGTDNLSDQEVLNQFPVSPVKMDMEMHMLGAMYAPTDDLTLMAMVSYVSKEMDHITRRGVRFTTNSEGFSDTKLTALYKILDRNRQRLHLNFGVSFPTGSINERDDTPAGSNQILPYPMQIGSGTFDLLPGITYLGQTDQGSWGLQALSVLRLGENSNDYRLGNQFQLTGWIARNWLDWFGTSIRLTGKTWGDIHGADPRLNPMMIPTADPNLRGGTRVDLGLGVNLYAPRGTLQGTRLAIELELPIYQSLEGPQLETDWQLTVGLQAAF
jgi:hypothetical protein